MYIGLLGFGLGGSVGLFGLIGLFSRPYVGLLGLNVTLPVRALARVLINVCGVAPDFNLQVHPGPLRIYPFAHGLHLLPIRQLEHFAFGHTDLYCSQFDALQSAGQLAPVDLVGHLLHPLQYFSR